MTYGDGEYGDPTPPQEPPVTDPYNFETLDKIRDLFVTNGQALWQGIDALVAEIRQLEQRERTFAEDLMAEAQAHNATRVDRARLAGQVAGLRAIVSELADERDTAVVRAEEAEEVAGAARVMLDAAYSLISDLGTDMDDLEQRHADDRLTIADLTQRLHDCEAE